ncbi:TetR/AcrR family transcriptional regulator [Desulfatitalea alkaliphila]|uniref:TetR/AcrR family transcriptional regulator n=1 Tax=Desulfatitalea alkaliphila TaxID=2929485 RepID=A0AA41UI13_9BACT|nr:TetR/AcrR family transcriptional regulator [Desulfatitalea alkaliphila]MCJ8500250.1 TetR/AcrR family transcriptional regulator [Desulfatitalea alkaliphila]
MDHRRRRPTRSVFNFIPLDDMVLADLNNAIVARMAKTNRQRKADVPMTYAEFSKLVTISKKDIFQETIAENRETMRVKKEKTVAKNLEKIFSAVLKISNRKGFKAMSMRDLSRESGLSMGALYSYFSSKDELLEILQHQRRSISERILRERVNAAGTAPEKLKAAIFTHLYLSEAMQPWYYFSFMEAKNLNKIEREKAVAGDLNLERVFESIIQQGHKEGVFRAQNPQLTASTIQAMLQDWYLKHSKFAKRNITVDQYAQFVLDLLTAFLAKK